MRAFGVALIATLAIATEAGAVTVQPHRAIYDLKLLSANDRSGITGVDGRLAFEVDGSACDGWTVNFRMVNQYLKSEGDPRLVDTQSTSYESGDGREMQYSDREFVDNRQASESRVKASRDNPASQGVGEFGTADNKKQFTLPAGVLFPIQHQIKITQEAEQGVTRDVSTLFDGSNDDVIYKVITFINPKHEAGQNSRDNANPAAAPLAKVGSWPVSMSYYKQGTGAEDTPNYQVSFDLYENGVATGLKLDYGDFVLQGDLTKLDYLETKACN